MDNKVKLGFFILSAAVVIIAGMLFYGIAKNQQSVNKANDSARSASRSALLVKQSAEQSHRALCNIKESDVSSLNSTRKYLRQHPNGLRSVGISKVELEQAVAKEARQVHALRDIKCS